MNKRLASSPHTHAGVDVSNIMSAVMVALTPATLFGFYQFGWPAIFLFVITLGTAVGSEALCLRIAGKPIKPSLADGSAALTGWLLAMSLPPWSPWWIGVAGGLFAIIIGKQIFGGIGQNVFNPAMLARVALLICAPIQMTFWVPPAPLGSIHDIGFLEGLTLIFSNTISVPDGFSGASLLGQIKTEIGQGHALSDFIPNSYEPLHAALGATSGSLGETSAILVLAGGLWLLFRRIISWHIPVSMLGTVAILSTISHFIEPQLYPDPVLTLLSGGLMLGAFFIATDFVTSPSTRVGQIIFGAGCGLLVFVIRTWGGYPEGVAFGVLLMNALTPVIDFYLRPRIYGRTIKGKPQTMPFHHKEISSKENNT